MFRVYQTLNWTPSLLFNDTADEQEFQWHTQDSLGNKNTNLDFSLKLKVAKWNLYKQRHVHKEDVNCVTS